MNVLEVAACLSLLAGCLAVPAHRLAGEESTDRALRRGEANPFQFPWQAGLLTTDNQFFCGASIIDPKWVLTAGHCVDLFTAFHVAVGGLDLPAGDSHESTRQVFATRDKHLHPRYDMVYLDNDVGLLRLPEEIKQSIFVGPVQLPSYSMAAQDLAGKVATVSGWGKTSDGSAASAVLMYTELMILPNSECENVYGNTMTGNKLCLSAREGNSVCQGDAGGALVMRNDSGVLGTEMGQLVQIGITSFVSAEGCTLRLPQGFTKVAAFLEFIEETTGLPISD